MKAKKNKAGPTGGPSAGCSRAGVNSTHGTTARHCSQDDVNSTRGTVAWYCSRPLLPPGAASPLFR
jgi:hypothetical protein